jgi:hypothetical protein
MSELCTDLGSQLATPADLTPILGGAGGEHFPELAAVGSAATLMALAARNVYQRTE